MILRFAHNTGGTLNEPICARKEKEFENERELKLDYNVKRTCKNFGLKRNAKR